MKMSPIGQLIQEPRELKVCEVDFLLKKSTVSPIDDKV